jgi:hypothetical protein
MSDHATSAPSGMIPAPAPETETMFAYDADRDAIQTWETALFSHHAGGPTSLFARLSGTPTWWPAWDMRLFPTERECLAAALDELRQRILEDFEECDRMAAQRRKRQEQEERLCVRLREMDAEVSE